MVRVSRYLLIPTTKTTTIKKGELMEMYMVFLLLSFSPSHMFIFDGLVDSSIAPLLKITKLDLQGFSI